MSLLKELEIPFEMNKEVNNEIIKIFLTEQNIALTVTNFGNTSN